MEKLLYIVARGPCSAKPVIDSLTRKMTAALRRATVVESWRGFFICICGARSTDSDYGLPDGTQINWLCVHYLAWHRHEVPAEQLAVVASLGDEAEPNKDELRPPLEPNRLRPRWTGTRGMVGGNSSGVHPPFTNCIDRPRRMKEDPE